MQSGFDSDCSWTVMKGATMSTPLAPRFKWFIKTLVHINTNN